MTLRYLLIDDDAGQDLPAEPYVKAINRCAGDALSVEAVAPGSLDGVIELIGRERPQGLFLDVALTNTLGTDGKPLSFDGITLAQQIRTLQTRARTSGTGLPEIPLIRLSKRDIIEQYVGGDTTSDDLFDERIDKAEVNDDPNGVVRRAVALARDYPEVVRYVNEEVTATSLATLLGCNEEFLDRLDDRLFVGLRRPNAPAHIIARFLTGALLAKPGPLVGERLLAIRLGIDPDLSRSPDWPKVCRALDPVRYQGTFAAGYPRWWMALLLDWWAEKVDSAKPLVRLPASQRALALRRALKFDELAAIEPTADSPGERYWYECLRSGAPVDPAYGFALLPSWPQEAWHDADYLCLEEAKRASREPRLGPVERSRLQELLASR